MHFTGKVTKIDLAGALVDIGVGRPAFLHISQIKAKPDQNVKKIEDVLKIDDEIDVWIKRVVKIEGKERVELTMLKPLDLEWRDIKTGMNVKGKVVRLEKFGAFIDIGAERPGLIHISEMAHGYVRQPSDVMKEGDEIESQIIDFDRKKRQIKLSIKAITPEPVMEVPEIIEPVFVEKQDRRSRKGNRKGKENVSKMDVEEAQAEPDPTAMELAIRAAMEKAKSSKKQSAGVKKVKRIDQEREDILTRTLEKKAPTR
jgi:predicted RNA-binding protein with RPS1 domain